MPELTNQMSHVTNFSFSDCSIPAESQFLRLNFYRIWSRSKSQQLSWCPQDDVTTGSGSSTLRRLLLFKDKMQLEIFSISKSLFSFLPSLQKATVWSPYRLDFVMSDAYLKACPDEFFNNNVVYSYFIIHLFFFCFLFMLRLMIRSNDCCVLPNFEGIPLNFNVSNKNAVNLIWDLP